MHMSFNQKSQDKQYDDLNCFRSGLTSASLVMDSVPDWMNLAIGLYGYLFLYLSHNPFSCRASLAVVPFIRGILHTEW